MNCPTCEGAGYVYAIVRPAHTQMVSPCEMEGRVECDECDGTGRIDELDCRECDQTFTVSEQHTIHFCEGESELGSFRCFDCVREGLHSAACLAESAEAAADAREGR